MARRWQVPRAEDAFVYGAGYAHAPPVLLTMTDLNATTTRSRFQRWVLALVGIGCVGVGALGVFVPGLPTTIFLIVATWCFARSCPFLERVLIRNKLFGPFLIYVDRVEPIPLRAKLIAIGTMWFFVAISVAVILLGQVPGWIAIVIALAACVGTVAILRWDAKVGERPRTESCPVDAPPLLESI